MGDVYKKAREVFERELDGIVGKGNISSSEVEVTYKIVDILKDLGEICKNDMEMNGMYGDEYSERYNWGHSGYTPSMGWYTGEYYNGTANRQGMRNGGYSRNSYSRNGNYGNNSSRNSEMMNKLQGLLNEANSDHERMMIQSWMNELSD